MIYAMNQESVSTILIREHQGTRTKQYRIVDVALLNIIFIMKAQPNDNTAITCWAFFRWQLRVLLLCQEFHQRMNAYYLLSSRYISLDYLFSNSSALGNFAKFKKMSAFCQPSSSNSSGTVIKFINVNKSKHQTANKRQSDEKLNKIQRRSNM